MHVNWVLNFRGIIMSLPNVFIVEFKNDKSPEGLMLNYAVKAATIAGLAKRMSSMVDDEVSILLIDVLDQDNHPGNAQISVGGQTYYADITPSKLLE